MAWTNPESRQLAEQMDADSQPCYVLVHLGGDVTFTGDWTEAEKEAVRSHLVAEPTGWLSPVDGWFSV